MKQIRPGSMALRSFVAIMIFAVLILTSCTSKPKLIGPVVETQSGLVQGVVNDDGSVMAFKGNPVA